MAEKTKKPETQAHKDWVRDNTVFVGIRLQKKTDADILDFLRDKPKQTAIKAALREYMNNHN
jgi:uncharacterized protein (DUF4415 family)